MDNEPTENADPLDDETAAIGDHEAGHIRRLNEEFYATNPGLQIERRVQLIATFADAPIVAPAGDFTNDVLSPMDGWELIGPDALLDKDGRAEAIIVEAFMVGFHACEVLLRQYFAHLDAADFGSPWHAMADELRPGKKFADRVTELRNLPTKDLHHWIHLTFIGHVDAIAEGIGCDGVDRLTESVAQWFRYFAKHYMEFRNTYNAAKHGLSTIPSHAQFTIAEEDDQGAPADVARVFLSGATLTTIEYKRGPEKGEITWSRVSHCIDPVVHVRIASVGAALVTHLRLIGKGRHIGGGFSVPTKPYPSVSATVRPRSRFMPGHFSTVIGHSSGGK